MAQGSGYVKVLDAVLEFDFGAQHKHGQALEGLGQERERQHQEKGFLALAVDQHGGLHTPFGVAKNSQAGLLILKPLNILAQLIM